ncbi:MAG: indole-3-glycerol-phosphate synthase [Nitrososphaerales archaeon]
MPDFLDKLAIEAIERVRSGYYNHQRETPSPNKSLKISIRNCRKIPIITELKAASPSKGTIRDASMIEEIVAAMQRGGAVGISVLTEPECFKGSLINLIKTKSMVKIPVLMKDIIVSPRQLEAAEKVGADAVLFIKALFDRGYCELDIHNMMDLAHKLGLEVLLEAHNRHEFKSALGTEADLLGVNNRDLRTLKVNLKTTRAVLRDFDLDGRLIVSESGIETPGDIRYLLSSGAEAFLVGSSIMKAVDIEKKVKELTEAFQVG